MSYFVEGKLLFCFICLQKEDKFSAKAVIMLDLISPARDPKLQEEKSQFRQDLKYAMSEWARRGIVSN